MSVAPKPEVLYLPAIFREISNGNTRVPAFQRGFVWRPKQVLELLESVYKYYPIGSLLFWHADIKEMQTDMSEDVPFPHPPVKGNVDFVLDGMQRISSLYGAFHLRANVTEQNDPFSVVFDLQVKQFRHSTERSPTSIDLRVLFAPRQLLAEQGRLGTLENGDALVEATIDLQRAFQEYLVPVVRIGNRTATEVVEIFERVNSTGTRLSAVDFMRALTWSSEFDLSSALAELRDAEADNGFEIPLDTIAKVLALKVGVIPTAGELLKLKQKSSADLLKATAATRDAIRHACNYLTEHLGILCYDYVPYEGQFLVLASAAASSDTMPGWLAQWFWTTGLSEALQGRPDYTVAKAASDVGAKPEEALFEYFSLTEDALRTRTVRKGAALSMTMIAALATAPSCSIFTGNVIPPEQFMGEYENRFLGTVFSKGELTGVVEPGPRGDKLIANIVLLELTERRPMPRPQKVREAILKLASREDGLRALQTQCISAECVDRLSRGDVGGFLRGRASELMKRARELAILKVDQ